MAVFNNIRKILAEKSISVSEFERSISLPRGGFYKWENHEPGISKVKAAAEYLGVSVDSLTSEQEVEDGKLSED